MCQNISNFYFLHSSVCKQLLYHMCSIPYLNEPYSIWQRYPTSGSWISTGQWHFRNQATRQVSGRWMSKASSNTYHLSPLLAFPSMEKLSSAKLVLGAKKVGERCSTSLPSFFAQLQNGESQMCHPWRGSLTSQEWQRSLLWTLKVGGWDWSC